MVKIPKFEVELVADMELGLASAYYEALKKQFKPVTPYTIELDVWLANKNYSSYINYDEYHEYNEHTMEANLLPTIKLNERSFYIKHLRAVDNINIGWSYMKSLESIGKYLDVLNIRLSIKEQDVEKFGSQCSVAIWILCC